MQLDWHAFIYTSVRVLQEEGVLGLHLFFLPEFIFICVLFHLLLSISRELSFSEKKEVTISLLQQLSNMLFFLSLSYLLGFFFQHTPVTLLHGMLWSSKYTFLMKFLLAVSGWVVSKISISYALAHKRHIVEYPVLLGLALFFMFILVNSCHLLTSFFAIVGFSLNLYVLVLFDVDAYRAREAGIKYFYLSTFSSGLIAFAVFLFFLLSETGIYCDISFFLAAPTVPIAEVIAKVATVFLLFGTFFKLAAFPGHLWAPDIYEGSPTPILVFFMTSTKIAAFSFLQFFLVQALDSLVGFWQLLLSIAAGGSMLWGCFGAFYEKKLKRFLAYTSINQVGFVLAGVSCGTIDGFKSANLYMVLYVLTTLGFLYILLPWSNSKGRPLLYLTDLSWFSVGKSDLQHILFFLATLTFSMAGIPPLAGFFGKYFVFLYGYEVGLTPLVIVGLSTSLVSAYYYLRLIKLFWFTQPQPNVALRIEFKTFQSLKVYNIVMSLFLWSFVFFIDNALEISSSFANLTL